ncbi:DUF5362 family protein [Flavobacterium flavipallidum]|uniref:DUF5362 family protein n=1 Tax=Flavobacterium flavipallidum TaxID=3139140 RepID=A0ABU9HMY0_9FLAO
MEEITTSEKPNLQLTDESKAYLKEIAKWAYFLAILGFVGVGFMVILALFMGTIFSKLGVFGARFGMMEGGFISVIYLLLAVLYFFPVYYLFQFASKAKAAFSIMSNEKLTESLEYLKSHYKFMGIMAIIIFSFYGVIFLFSIIGFLFSSF